VEGGRLAEKVSRRMKILVACEFSGIVRDAFAKRGHDAMRTDRLEIYNKYQGHCAYCGRKITFKQMQVDHYWPKYLAHFQPGQKNHRPDNLMPSCQKCNIHKHRMKPEEWRLELARQVTMLRKNAQFNRALIFGQIEITEKPIIFYFEQLNRRIKNHGGGE